MTGHGYRPDKEGRRQPHAARRPHRKNAAITILPEKRYGYLTLLQVAFRRYPKRAILGATLMITQSFLYNAIFAGRRAGGQCRAQPDLGA